MEHKFKVGDVVRIIDTADFRCIIHLHGEYYRLNVAYTPNRLDWLELMARVDANCVLYKPAALYNFIDWED